MANPAVAEAGAYGVPDAVAGNVVHAVVVLRPGFEAVPRARPRAARPRPRPARGRRGATPDLGGRHVAPHPQRQDHATPPAGAGARLAEGDTSDPGERHDLPAPPRQRAGSRARAAADDAAHPPLRGALRRALQRRQDPRVPAPLRRRGSRGRRRLGGTARGRQRRGDLPGARPRTGARCADGRGDGRDVRPGRGLQRGAGRLDAPVRRRRTGSSAATRSWAAACPSRSGWRWPTSSVAPTAIDGVLLRRGRHGRRRVPREHEPGCAVEAARAVRAARTTSMRWVRRSSCPSRPPTWP